MWYEISEPRRPVTPQPDLTGQWQFFSYTQRHYPILPWKNVKPRDASVAKNKAIE